MTRTMGRSCGWRPCQAPTAPASCLEAVVRIAETFNVSVDYLVTPDAPRTALHAPQNILGARLADLSQLDDDERATILAVIDAITTKAKPRLITGGAS